MTGAAGVDGQPASTAARGRTVTTLVVGGLGLASLALPWVRWQTLEGDGTRSGWKIPGASWITIVAAIGLVVAGGIALARSRSLPKVLAVALMLWMALPAMVVIAVAESVSGSVVGWLMPVVSVGRLLTVNPAGGAWVATLAGLGGAALVIIDVRRGIAAAQSARRRAAIVVVGVSTLGLLVARALPWYTVEVVELELGGDDGRVVVDAVVSQANIEVTGADVPVLGQATLIAVLILVVCAVLALRRMTDVLVTVIGAAAGTLLFAAWLSLALIDGSDSAIPDWWLSLGQGDEVVAAGVAPGLWLTGGLAVLLLAAAAVAHRRERPTVDAVAVVAPA